MTAQDVQSVAKAYLNDNSIFGGDESQIRQALEEAGFADTQLQQAIIENKDAIRELALSYDQAGQSIDALSSIFYQANIDTEFGDALKQRLGDDAELYSLTEQFLADKAQGIADELIAGGTGAGEALEQALIQVSENFDQYYAEAVSSAKTREQEVLGRGDSRLTEYYDNLTDEEKTVFLTLDFDKDKSTSQMLQHAEEAIEEFHDNIESRRAALDEDVDEEE